MQGSNQKPKTVPWDTPAEIDPNMKSRENDPVFIKQAERAKEFLRLHPIPDWILKKHENK